MARCPISGRQEADVYLCESCPGLDICRACPAYDIRVPLVLAWRWLVRMILPLLAGLLLFGGTAAPAAADHNPLHTPTKATAAKILKGQMGGTFYASRTAGRVTWTNGQYVAVYQNGVCVTLFKSRNAAQYVAKDAAAHGAAAASRSTASAVVRASAAKNIAARAGAALAGPAGVGLLGEWSIWAGCQANPGLCGPKSGAVAQ